MNLKNLSIAFPPQSVTNKKYQELFPSWNREKFELKVGIESRYVANEIGVAEMAMNALEGLNIDTKPGKDDILIFCSQSPDYKFPGPGHELAKLMAFNNELGIIDVNLGCSGYVHSLMLASAIIRSKTAKRVFIITSETYSKQIAQHDVNNLAMFGDAATASMIDSSSEVGEHFVYGSDGKGFDNLYCAHFKNKQSFLQMNGPEILNFTMERIPIVFKELLEKNRLTKDEVDYVIFHQANSLVVNNLAQLCNLTKNQYHCDVKFTGNTVSNSIPIALYNAYQEKRIVSGNLVMLIGFGVGYSWSGGIIKVK